jgi:hypothetical protein
LIKKDQRRELQGSMNLGSNFSFGGKIRGHHGHQVPPWLWPRGRPEKNGEEGMEMYIVGDKSEDMLFVAENQPFGDETFGRRTRYGKAVAGPERCGHFFYFCKSWTTSWEDRLVVISAYTQCGSMWVF